MPLRLVPSPDAMAILGERGWALASTRLSDFLTSCLSCGQPLAASEVTISADPAGPDHVMIRARHVECPPTESFEVTHLISGLLLGDRPFLLIHPSAEVLWLRRAADGDEWIDDTATAFTELGLQRGRPGQDLQLQPAPNATIQITGDTVTIDMPPMHRWRAEIPTAVVAAIRAHGRAILMITTAIDHQDFDTAKFSALLAAGDYVAGIADHAPVGRSRHRSAHAALRHPVFTISSPKVNARTIYLDDPEIGWASAVVDDGAIDLAGQSTDRVPVALMETPSTVTDPDQPGDYLVEAMIGLGLSRVAPPVMRLPQVPDWEASYTPGQVDVRSPDGTRIVADHTPDPQWLSTAHGHGAIVVLYGPALGVRDAAAEGTRSFDACDRRDELTAAVQRGHVAGGLVAFRGAAQVDDDGEH